MNLNHAAEITILGFLLISSLGCPNLGTGIKARNIDSEHTDATIREWKTAVFSAISIC